MHYTKLINEEHFTPGRPLMIALLIAEEDSTCNEVGYLVEELQTSARWPILELSFIYKMYRNINTEMHPHSSCIILTPGQCEEWELYIARFWQQLYESFHGKNSRYPMESKSQIHCLTKIKLHSYGKYTIFKSYSL